MVSLLESRPRKQMRVTIDLKDQKFGLLTVVDRGQHSPDGESTWLCRCDCGAQKTIRHGNLKKTKSCGCIKSSKRPKYAEFVIRQSMISRCYNAKNASYRNYGGRGIKVCERWRLSFDHFLADIGQRPAGCGHKISAYALDRIDNNGDYEPSNVRWVTARTQHLNKRNNRRFTIDGRTMTITEWAHEFGKSPELLNYRLKIGKIFSEALTSPVRHYHKKNGATR